ncbi:MAG: hypothetical protein E2O84_04980 [Bacteroidetes bacterium]|nr:MAG: hypothetical protein E2O84_04980 [Bacteroidota bacterium]
MSRIKTATIFPENAARSIPSVMETYLLLDGSSGEPVALLDGKEITVLRTSAASALASRYLSKKIAARY